MIIVHTQPGHTCHVGPSAPVGERIDSTALALLAAAAFRCDACGRYWCATCIGKNRGECPTCKRAAFPLIDGDPLVENLVKVVDNARCEQHQAIDCEHRCRAAVEALTAVVQRAFDAVLRNGGAFYGAEFGAPSPPEK